MPRPGTTVVDKYVVEDLLGVGGMGAVVSARRRWDGVRVALKVMLAAEAKHEDSTRRFFREARAAGVIDSPHVAKLLDFGRLDDGTPFMVLELLHGEGLDELIRTRAPLPIEEAVDLILQAAEGVAEAHARGIVHRDIKPSNLHVSTATDGSALLKVLDFGISKAPMKFEQEADGPSLTETNVTLGSPQYMSPEQLRSSKDVDARTDIWSLGLILHKMLTGRPAFEAPNVGAHFAMILADPPTRLRQRRPDAPQQLDDVLWTCLEKQREERWQDLGQFASALALFGTDSARLRAQRIAAILDVAGVASTTRPRVVYRDDPTLRESPKSKRPLPIEAPLSAPATMPGGAQVSGAFDGERTKSTWSPVTHRINAPARRVRRLMITAGVAVLVAMAFGAGRLLQGEGDVTPVAPAASSVSNVASAAPEAAPDKRKSPLLEKARSGSATRDELRTLEALCVLEADDACVAVATAAAKPPAASAVPKPKPKPTRRLAPKPPASAEKPQPPPKTAPPAPEPTIKPKGPMVDKL